MRINTITVLFFFREVGMGSTSSRLCLKYSIRSQNIREVSKLIIGIFWIYFSLISIMSIRLLTSMSISLSFRNIL